MLGQIGAPVGFTIASGLFAYLYSSLSMDDFLDWGWRYPFYVAFAINVVALFARLHLVATNEYARLLSERELEPTKVVELVRAQGSTLVIGAFAALASYALFHLVTVFPLSWIKLYSTQDISEFLVVQMIGAGLATLGIIASGKIADRVGRRRTLGTVAVLIAVFSGFAPTLLGGGRLGQDIFILLGFSLLGLSYGQASGAVTSNFESEVPLYRRGVDLGPGLAHRCSVRASRGIGPVRPFRPRVRECVSAVRCGMHAGSTEPQPCLETATNQPPATRLLATSRVRSRTAASFRSPHVRARGSARHNAPG